MALTALATASGSSASVAAPTEMQVRIDQVLAVNPGSIQTDWNEVTMAGGDPVLTLAVDTPAAAAAAAAAKVVGGCTAGKFCAYQKVGYLGDKLTYSTCGGSQSVAGLAAVRSVANSRTSGSVRAHAGSKVLATIAAGTGKNVSAGTTNLTCS